MLIPANAVGKVLGKGGANIANIRKVGLHILNLLFFMLLQGLLIFYFEIYLKVNSGFGSCCYVSHCAFQL